MTARAAGEECKVTVKCDLREGFRTRRLEF